MVHPVLTGSLHAKLRGALKILITKRTHLVYWSTKITLSIAVAVIVAIVATRVTSVASIAATILSLVGTKGSLWPTPKTSITIPVPVIITTKVAPPTPRIPITSVVLVATSSPPSTTCTK